MNEDITIPEFGIQRENEERRDGGCAVVFDPETKLFAAGRQFETKALRLFSGGVSEGESMEDGIIREVVEESGLHNFSLVENLGQAYTHYFNVLKKVNRVALATCLLIVLENRNLTPVELEAHETFSLDWVTAEELVNDWIARNENKDHDHWLYFMEKALVRLKELKYLA